MFVQVNKKSIRVELSPKEQEEYQNRVRKAMMAEDIRLKAIEADRKARGYCPDCHMLCTKDHRCMRCGKIITEDDIAAQAERRKKILELNQKRREAPKDVFYQGKSNKVSSYGDQAPFYIKVYTNRY